MVVVAMFAGESDLIVQNSGGGVQRYASASVSLRVFSRVSVCEVCVEM